jgi:hypothetical protein
VLSEWKYGGQPPESENPAAANGRASRKEHTIEPDDIAETAADRQARKLRGRFALGYCTAMALAPLIWGVAPR